MLVLDAVAGHRPAPRRFPLALGAGKSMIAMVSVLSRLVTIPGPGDVRPAARRGRQGAFLTP